MPQISDETLQTALEKYGNSVVLKVAKPEDKNYEWALFTVTRLWERHPMRRGDFQRTLRRLEAIIEQR